MNYDKFLSSILVDKNKDKESEIKRILRLIREKRDCLVFSKDDPSEEVFKWNSLHYQKQSVSLYVYGQ